jgi:hypothetical protein
MAGERRRPALRYSTIDVLRGLALVSMVSAHLDDFEFGNWTARVLHSGRWIDGAFFFVALSGLVTGLVHRRVVERDGVEASVRKLVRRSGFLYLVHVLLVLVCLAAYNLDPTRAITDTPTWREEGGVPVALWRVLVLRLEPNLNTILPMYVALLLWAVLVVILLRNRAWWAVVLLSTAVYVVGQAFTGLHFAPDGFAIADWQLLFTGGLLIGWLWEYERLSLSLQLRRAIVVAAGALAMGFYAAAHLAPGPVEHRLGAALWKQDGGWAAFLFAAAVLVAGYGLVESARRTSPISRALRPVETLGRKGLPGYATMVLAVLVLDFLPSIPRNDATVALIVVVCGVAEYLAVEFDNWRRSLASNPPAALVYRVGAAVTEAQPALVSEPSAQM